MWLAESPDGSSVIAVGLRQPDIDVTQYNGYVIKINSATGEKVWSFDVPVDAGTLAGARSGFECIEFTEDGGFIVGGFMNRDDTEVPTFKERK